MMHKYKFFNDGYELGVTEPHGAPELKDGDVLYLASDVDARIAELEKALNPRRWTIEQDQAWHRNLPDVYAAFEALRSSLMGRESQ
jgi:hypothetical protein